MTAEAMAIAGATAAVARKDQGPLDLTEMRKDVAEMRKDLAALAERARLVDDINTISRADLAKLWGISDDTLERLEMRLGDDGKPLLRRLPHLRHARYALREVRRFMNDHPAEI